MARLRRGGMAALVGTLLSGALSMAPAAFAAAPSLVTLAGTGQSSAFQAPAPATPATSVAFGSANGIEPDAMVSGAYLIADAADNRILRLSRDGFLGNFVGDGTAGYPGSGGVAEFRGPVAITHYLYGVNDGYIVADNGNHCTRFINAGTGTNDVSDSQGQCNASTPFAWLDGTSGSPGTMLDVRDVASPPGSNIYYLADSSRIRQVDSARTLTTLSGCCGYPPADGTSLSSADPGYPTDIFATSTVGDFYFATDNISGTGGRIIHVTGGKVYTVAGGGTGLGDGGTATSASLVKPSSVLKLADGGLLIYDAGHARIRRVSSSGTITTIAGTGTAGSSPDGTPADQASIAGNGSLVMSDRGVVFTQTAPGGMVRLLPASSIVSGPSGITSSTSAEFGLASWDSSASFQCKLDDGAFGVCHGYTNLPEGSHTFVARATTDNGTRVDTAGATRTWTIDTSGPAAPALTEPADGATLASVTTTLKWQPTTDAVSGVARYDVYLDDALAGKVDKCDSACSFDVGGLTESTHHWQVRAVDGSGNETASATRTFTVASPPVAALAAAPSRVLVGRPVTLDASGSTDIGAGIVRYEFDTDGDGSFETDNGGQATLVRTYDTPQTLTVGVRVTDGAGFTSTATTQVTVTIAAPAGKPLGVSINDGAQYTNDPHVTVFGVWPSFASTEVISNDGGFGKAQSFPVAEQIPWVLDSSGPERLPKTIYVRFISGAQTSETYQDDIILDQTPPKVDAAEVAAPAAASAARVRKVTLKIRASDNLSGVGSAQVTSNKRRPGKLLAFKKRLKVAPAKKLFVRVRDRAGNFSAWRTAKRR